MQNYDDLIRKITEQNTQLIEENRRLKDRLDVALNTIALQAEEIQRLKDEIAILKGQKPRPKIPPSVLEGPKSKITRKSALGENIPAGKRRAN